VDSRRAVENSSAYGCGVSHSTACPRPSPQRAISERLYGVLLSWHCRNGQEHPFLLWVFGGICGSLLEDLTGRGGAQGKLVDGRRVENALRSWAPGRLPHCPPTTFPQATAGRWCVRVRRRNGAGVERAGGDVGARCGAFPVRSHPRIQPRRPFYFETCAVCFPLGTDTDTANGGVVTDPIVTI
jgi:hypothetical protein